MKKYLLMLFLMYVSIIYSQVQQPYNPSPIDGMSDAYLSDSITFTGGSHIDAPQEASYRIYLDTNSNPTTVFANTSLSTIDYFFGIDLSVNYYDLIESTEYYWKVEVVGSDGTILATSPIWSFTTKPIVIGDGGVFTGSIQLESQEDVDTFAANLYTSITGDLTIGVWGFYNSSIIDLSSLTNLTSIDGSLNIYGNRALSSLNGLDNIVSISGNLEIYDLPILAEVKLSSLTSIGGGLELFYLNNVPNFNHLSNLSTIGDNTYINHNPSITSLSGLSSLSFINGLLSINNNDSLTTIGLDALTSVGNLIIQDNQQLMNFHGLENINLHNRNIFISQNNSITSLEGLLFNNSHGSLSIENNPNLSDLSQLISLNSIIGILNIHNNDAITNLDAFSNLSVAGGIGIGNNVNLDNFCGLTTLMSNNFTGSFSVSGNAYNPSQQDIIDGNCETLSVEEFQLNQVKIYPNPTTDYLTIDSEFEITKAQIYTLQGQKITSHSNQNKIDVSSLSNGMYFLKITDNTKRTQSIRFIKN